MAFVKKALELVSPHLCVRECVLADPITEPALKQYLEMGIITSHYILILFFFFYRYWIWYNLCVRRPRYCVFQVTGAPPLHHYGGRYRLH